VPYPVGIIVAVRSLVASRTSLGRNILLFCVFKQQKFC